MSEQISRRRFLERTGQTAVAGAALAGAIAPAKARAAFAANEQIRIGLIGCGIRNTWLVSNWLPDAAKQHNATVVACCDIWRPARERMVKTIKDKYGQDAAVFTDHRALLDRDDIDAVMIATPDHQHCGMLIDAVKAGKDVYVEKPIAMDMEELNAAYDAVKETGRIVQHGTQGRSCRGADSAKAFIQSGKLGKLIRIEESRSFYNPYWNGYTWEVKAEDTNWKAFLYNRRWRPFSSDQHAAWMGYRDFSTGTVGGWMSHFSDLVHYVTGADFPISAVAQGGIYSPTSEPQRTCPDTFTGILEYPDAFTTSYTTHFGNGANDYILWFGTKGTMRTGAPDGWPNGIEPRVSGTGSQHPEKLADDEIALDNTTPEAHMPNWVRCVREGKQPNANMEAGYRHGVAMLMCDRAFVEGRKMTFDIKKREIRPA